jgi:hypothetical protein
MESILRQFLLSQEVYCLSILVEGDKETLYTLVVPKNYEIIFDNQKNIIGMALLHKYFITI